MQRLRVCLLIWMCLAAAAATSHAQNLHVLMVIDDSPGAQWGQYQPNMFFDFMHMNEFFNVNSPEKRLKLEVMYIDRDADARPAKVAARVRELRPGPNDTVVFYYTGHGGLDDRGSYFDLVGGKLYREEVRGLLTAKRPRLAVLLTDCCNSRGDGRNQIAGAPFFEYPESFTPLFQSLFMKPSGLVDVNSSAPGQSAFFIPFSDDPDAEQGSIFTTTLTSWCKTRQNRETTWDEMIREVSMIVHMVFRNGYPNGASIAKGGNLQTNQDVYAPEYPGMPPARGLRAGIQVRDDARGVLIIRVDEGSPAAGAYEIAVNRYVPLAPGQILEQANGKPVTEVADFTTAVKESPQIMRVTIEDDAGATREFLVRLRY